MAELKTIPLNSDVAESFRETLKQVLQAVYSEAKVTVKDDLVIFEHSAEPTEERDGFYHKISGKLAEIKMR
jgi:hypothetical protein